MGQFLVMDGPMLDDFFEFRSVHTKKRIADLRLTTLLEFYMQCVARIPPSSVMSKFGQLYLPMEMEDVD